MHPSSANPLWNRFQRQQLGGLENSFMPRFEKMSKAIPQPRVLESQDTRQTGTVCRAGYYNW